MQIRCPYCGSPNIARILYGLPVHSEELANEIDQGNIILGGCCITGHDPTLQCNKCKKRFGKDPIFNLRGKEYTPHDLSEIEFNIGGFFSGFDIVEIKRNELDTILRVSHIPMAGDNCLSYSRSYRKCEWDALMKTLFDHLFVHEWKRSYIDYRVLDGCQWHFTLTFTDGKKKEISGSNKYPALWSYFNRRFENYIREAQKKRTDP